MIRRLSIAALTVAAFVATDIDSRAFIGEPIIMSSVAPATASLTASPTNINSGASSTLTWASTNAPSCTSPDIPSFSGATSGNTSVSPTSTTTYHVTCSSASASATVTVTSGTIPCDIGPSYVGSIPAAAAQAGFTHCAANYDFTQTQSFTDTVATHQWSNLSSWFTCNAATATSGFLMSWQGDVPCDTNHVNVANDGSIQTLALSYYLTDKNNNVYSTDPVSGQLVGTTLKGVSFPAQNYTEQVFRLSVVDTCAGGACLLWAPFWVGVEIVNNGCFLEEDWDEVGSPGATATNTASRMWNASCPNGTTYYGPSMNTIANGGSPPATTSYNTYGELWTADGTTNAAYCTYWGSGVVSGLTASAFRNCVSWAPGSQAANPSQMFHAREQMNLAEGPESSGSGGTYWTATSETTYIQRITVWVCTNTDGGADWRTGSCFNNPVITTHP